jgi:hypothetical protein
VHTSSRKRLAPRAVMSLHDMKSLMVWGKCKPFFQTVSSRTKHKIKLHTRRGGVNLIRKTGATSQLSRGRSFAIGPEAPAPPLQ